MVSSPVNTSSWGSMVKGATAPAKSTYISKRTVTEAASAGAAGAGVWWAHLVMSSLHRGQASFFASAVHSCWQVQLSVASGFFSSSAGVEAAALAQAVTSAAHTGQSALGASAVQAASQLHADLVSPSAGVSVFSPSAGVSVFSPSAGVSVFSPSAGVCVFPPTSPAGAAGGVAGAGSAGGVAGAGSAGGVAGAGSAGGVAGAGSAGVSTTGSPAGSVTTSVAAAASAVGSANTVTGHTELSMQMHSSMAIVLFNISIPPQL